MSSSSYCYKFYFHDLALFQVLNQRICLANPGYEVQALGLEQALASDEQLQDFKLTATFLSINLISSGLGKANLSLIRAASQFACDFVRVDHITGGLDQELHTKRHYFYQAKPVPSKQLDQLLGRYEPQARLFRTFEQQDLWGLQAALQDGLDVNTQIDHKTLLWLAYEYSSLPMFVSLLAKGANANCLDAQGRSLIERIVLEARSDGLAFCQSLIQHGIDLHQCFADGGSLLWHAWVYNKPLALRLIELNAPYIRAFGAYQGKDNLLSVQTAIGHNDINKIARFMSKVDKDDYHLAQIAKTCSQVDHLPVFEQIQGLGFNAFSDLELAEELLLSAADAHALDILSELFSQAQLFKFCFAAIADQLLIAVADLNGAEHLVQTLLDQGASIGDNQALIQALHSNELGIASMLIRAGMPINSNARGEDSSLLAEQLPKLSAQAVRLLLDAGADPLLPCRHKGNALEQALAATSISADVSVMFAQLLQRQPPEEAIWIALRANNQILFRRFWQQLSQRERIDCLNDLNQNLLVGACDAMALNIAEYLIRQQCFNLASQDARGNTALAYAVLNGQELLVQLLIEAGAKVNSRLHDRRNEKRCIGVATEPEKFLAEGARNHIGFQAQQFYNPDLERDAPKSLHQYLLLGQKIHQKLEPNIERCPLLLWASANGQLEICQLLIDAGAELECQDLDAHGVLFFSLAHGDEVLFEFFVEQGCDYRRLDKQGYNLIHTAVLRQQAKLLPKLLELGLSLNAQAGPQGLTPLMLAAQLGLLQQEDMLGLLLEANADIQRLNHASQSALCLACEVGNQAAIAALLKAGAEVDALDRFGFSAYDYFASHQLSPRGFRLDELRPELGKVLLAKGWRLTRSFCYWQLLPSLALAALAYLYWPEHYQWVLAALAGWCGLLLLQRPLRLLCQRYLGIKHLPGLIWLKRKLRPYWRRRAGVKAEFSVRVKA